MSVLIKGMKKPKNCDECPLADSYLACDAQSINCPIIEVSTPHGRLKDADMIRKFVEGLPNCYNGFSDTYDKSFIIGMIDEMPTIIEAEEGANNTPEKG